MLLTHPLHDDQQEVALEAVQVRVDSTPEATVAGEADSPVEGVAGTVTVADFSPVLTPTML